MQCFGLVWTCFGCDGGPWPEHWRGWQTCRSLFSYITFVVCFLLLLVVVLFSFVGLPGDGLFGFHTCLWHPHLVCVALSDAVSLSAFLFALLSHLPVLSVSHPPPTVAHQDACYRSPHRPIQQGGAASSEGERTHLQGPSPAAARPGRSERKRAVGGSGICLRCGQRFLIRVTARSRACQPQAQELHQWAVLHVSFILCVFVCVSWSSFYNARFSHVFFASAAFLTKK